MRIFILVVLGFLVGAMITFGVGMSLPSIMSISQAEGAYAMSIAFFWTPAGGVLGAILAVLLRRR